MARVSFLGLGTMGYPMAGHLVKAGHEVTVYNRTSLKAKTWVQEFKGRYADTPASAALDADFVISCVGNDDNLRSVTVGFDGAFQTLKPNSIFIDHSTVSAALSQELSREAGQRSFDFLDAPVSGGQSGAEKGSLSVMVGGDEKAVEKSKPIISSYSQSCVHIGPSGSGQITKMVNQICIAGILQGLAEGLNFAKSLGLDATKVLAAISQGAAGSWQMNNRGMTMAQSQFNFGFAVDWMRKDLGICLHEARQQGVSLPITALIDQFYAELQNMGHGRSDTSSLIVRLEALSKSK